MTFVDPEHYRIASFIGALTIEVRTGMVHSRGSVLAAAQQQLGIKARTKRKALDELHVLYEQRYGRKYGE